jgi:hypothetical protein
MAQLTLPIVAGELLIDVRLNLHAPALAAFQTTQKAAPASVPAKAILDTGSNVTGVSTALIQQLSLVQTVPSKTHGIGGVVQVQMFRASLIIVDPVQPQVPWFVQPDLLVMELPPGTPADVLIGMDILLDFRLLMDGPNRQFTLDY